MGDDGADMRFLSKVSSVVYMQFGRNKEIEVSFIAPSVSMSARQFYRKISALKGNAPSASILCLKIKKARNLLDGNPQVSFGEAADGSGFIFKNLNVRVEFLCILPIIFIMGNND